MKQWKRAFVAFTEFKKIGKIKLGHQVSVGEMEFKTIDITPGVYNVFYLGGSLMIFHEDYKHDMSRKTFDSLDWKRIKSKDVSVDGGSFGFFNSEIVEKFEFTDHTDHGVTRKIYGVSCYTEHGDGVYSVFRNGSSNLMLLGKYPEDYSKVFVSQLIE